MDLCFIVLFEKQYPETSEISVLLWGFGSRAINQKVWKKLAAGSLISVYKYT